jgi:hypothetical protein
MSSDQRRLEIRSAALVAICPEHEDRWRQALHLCELEKAGMDHSYFSIVSLFALAESGRTTIDCGLIGIVLSWSSSSY